MANLKDIRNKIKSVKSIQQVTKAMKMVAAAKLRKSQESMEKSRPYSGSIKDTINSILPDINRSLLPILDSRPVKKSLFVAISADRGMAGGFNANVIKRTEKEINEFGKNKSELICIGKKAYDHFKTRDYNIVKFHLDFWSDLKFNAAKSIGDDIVERYRNKEIDSVHFIYNEFKSSQGFTPGEILSKSSSLKGVLEPFSSKANIMLLPLQSGHDGLYPSRLHPSPVFELCRMIVVLAHQTPLAAHRLPRRDVRPGDVAVARYLGEARHRSQVSRARSGVGQVPPERSPVGEDHAQRADGDRQLGRHHLGVVPPLIGAELANGPEHVIDRQLQSRRRWCRLELHRLV